MTFLSCIHVPGVSSAELANRVMEAVAIRSDVKRWLVNYSLTNACICDASTSLPSCLEGGTIGGHLFDDSVEARWRLNGDTFDLWTLSESNGPDDTPLDCELRRYYCSGTWNGSDKPGIFRDGRLPHAISYPIDPVRQSDRVFFEIKEYSPVEPQSGVVTESEEVRLKRVIRELNQPRVVAYRLVRIGVGRSTSDGTSEFKV